MYIDIKLTHRVSIEATRAQTKKMYRFTVYNLQGVLS